MTLTDTETCTVTHDSWPTTRILFALAGSITLLSAALTATVSPWFLLLTAFAGFNQLLYVTTGRCPASLIIDHLRPSSPAGTRGMLNADHHKET